MQRRLCGKQTENRKKRQGLDLEHELPAGMARNPRPGQAQTASEGEASGLEAELQKLKAERDSLLDRLARAQAEFDNARRRAAKEQQDFRDFATVDAIKSLLPVIDSFERALQAKSEPADFRSRRGISSTSNCRTRSQSSECSRSRPKASSSIRMCMRRSRWWRVPDAPDHEVLEEWQRGYKFKDRLLRPAMVKVAKNPGK